MRAVGCPPVGWLAAISAREVMSIAIHHRVLFRPPFLHYLVYSCLLTCCRCILSLMMSLGLQEMPKDSNVSLLRLSTEALLVEGLSSLVASASAVIPSPGREEDVHALLNALIDAFSRQDCSCSLSHLFRC